MDFGAITHIATHIQMLYTFAVEYPFPPVGIVGAADGKNRRAFLCLSALQVFAPVMFSRLPVFAPEEQHAYSFRNQIRPRAPIGAPCFSNSDAINMLLLRSTNEKVFPRLA